MSENNDFIQLPPIKKDTPSEVVSMIWQYLKLPEESRKRVKADLIDVHENCGKENFQIPDLYDIVPNLSIEEASIYSNIGTGKLYEMTEKQDCPFVLWIGSRRMIKRKIFEEYIANQYSI